MHRNQHKNFKTSSRPQSYKVEKTRDTAQLILKTENFLLNKTKLIESKTIFQLFSVLSSLHLNQYSQFSHKKSWKRSRCIKIHRFLSKSHCLSVFSILEVQEVNSTLNLVHEEFAETKGKIKSCPRHLCEFMSFKT